VRYRRNGFIDKDEYWGLTSQLPIPEGYEWTRAMSDAEVDDMDTDGDGVVPLLLLLLGLPSGPRGVLPTLPPLHCLQLRDL